ncbi:MAG: hypothetical protein DWI28_06885 [Planctomycetota bacterium]|nr:MAG: hypothetical protein DWI28_06885 [Planctomycetota bacterium]
MRKWPARLLAWQSVQRNRIILTAIDLVCCIALFGMLCWSSADYAALRSKIVSVISEANIAEQNPIAMQMIERGTVTIDGVEIGGPRIQAVAIQMFNRTGKIDDAAYASSFIASTVAPEWAPVNIVERPWFVFSLSILLTFLTLLAIWLGLSIHLIFLIVLTTGLMSIFWMTGQLNLLVAIAGIGFLTFTFLLLTRLALVALSASYQIVGVAHTLLIEALRQRISIAFITVLIVVIPLIPIGIDGREPLRYQVQTFISRGTGFVFLVAACLTLFLSCSTVAFEIRDRQIWNILTKPVSRLQYLTGKLLGLSVLNAIILSVGSFAVFCNVQLISTRPAGDIQDSAAVQNQVLVAREVAHPAFIQMDSEILREIVNSAIKNDSVLRSEIDDGIKSESVIARQIRTEKVTEFMMAQRTIDSGRTKTFEFSGLQEARRVVANPVLRYCFHASRESSHDLFPAVLTFGDTPPIQINFVPVQRNVIPIPIAAIREDGTLSLKIFDGGLTRDGEFYPGEFPMNFEAEGLVILHRVGGFEANFFRAVLIDWAKLIFIAALGVSSASVLSFPVSVFLTITIFIIGSISPFLSMALQNYSISSDSNVAVQIIQYIISSVCTFVGWGLAPFASTASSEKLVDGQAISWWMVLVAVCQIGIAWSLIVFGLGLSAFHRKEIAIYSGGDS